MTEQKIKRLIAYVTKNTIPTNSREQIFNNHIYFRDIVHYEVVFISKFRTILCILVKWVIENDPDYLE
jgi:hypothetical protein